MTLASRAAAVVLACGLLAFHALAAPPVSPQGVITGKAFFDIGGTAVNNLTSNVKFPDHPDMVRYEPYFEWYATGDINTAPPNNVFDTYGVQVSGYFYPPDTGQYSFLLAADDNARLYLSTDSTAGNKKLIAQETAWSDPRQYFTSGGGSSLEAKDSSRFTGTEWPEKDPNLGGARITLQQGQVYYIEALMKEGNGGDNLSVACLDPMFAMPFDQPIPGRYLSSSDKATGPCTITTQPQSQTVNEGQSVTFSVVVDGTPPYEYQWKKNGADIPGATRPSYTLSRALRADNGAQFTVAVTGVQGSTTSVPAVLTVVEDNTRPILVSATPSLTYLSITVTFSKPLDPVTAQNIGNYQISGGIAVLEAILQAPAGTEGDHRVVLATSLLSMARTYTLVVNNVKDASGNTIAPNSQVQFKSFAFIRFAEMVEVAASSEYNSTTYAAANAFNGSGLSEDGNLHAASGFWSSEGTSPINTEWVKVRFDRSYPLSHLRVWNYNEPGYLGSGVRSADVYVTDSDLDPGQNAHLNGLAFDPTGWTQVLTNQTFVQAPSGGSIANTDSYIGLGGVTARQLAIKINANWGDADYVGLAEVQIYPVVSDMSEAKILTFKHAADSGVISETSISLNVPYDVDVTALAPTYTVSAGATGSPPSGTARNFSGPQTYTVVSGDGSTTNIYTVTVIKSAFIRFAEMVEVAASSHYDGYPPVNAFNGSGLSEDGNTHAASDLWSSEGTSPINTEWVKVRFDRSYPLSHLRVWNYNEADYLGMGVSSADVYVIGSDLDPGNNTHLNALPFDATGWTLVLTNQTFVQAPVSGSITNTDPHISLGGISARQMAIKVKANWGDPDYVGLAEVRIYPTPLTPPKPELPGSALTMSPLGVPTFNFGTVAGYKYRLVYSDDVATPTAGWQAVTPPGDGWVLATGATMSLTDTNAVGHAQRFYRLEAAIP